MVSGEKRGNKILIRKIAKGLTGLPKSLKSVFLNLSMRRKLLITFVMISLVPTLLLGSFYYVFSYNSLIDQKIMESNNLLKNISNSTVETLFKATDYSLIQFSLNKTVQELMQADLTDLDDLEYQNETIALKKLFMDNTFRKHIDYIGVVGKNAFSMASSAAVEQSMQEMVGQAEFAEFEQGISNYWRGPIVNLNGSNYKVIARKVYSDSAKGVIGYTFMWINERGLHEIFDHYRHEITGVLLILNPDGTIFSSTNPRHKSGENIQKFYTDLNLNKPGMSQRVLSNGNKYILTSYMDDAEGLYSMNVMPLGVVIEGTSHIVQITITMMLALLLFCFMLATLLARYFTVPILKLSDSMSSVEIGKVRTNFIPRYDDEIGYLARCFNQMAEKLNQQAEIIEQTQQKQREAEMKAFESQIKPHFLYNTLSTVIWLVQENQLQKAIKITSALSRMFRISISRGKNIIPIEKEIQHATNYLDIQKVRYGNEFDYQLDVSEEVLEYYTVKMVLQPLVENSIYHGMRYRQNGRIVISCFEMDGYVVMQVKDNGERMTEETCRNINAKLQNLPIQKIEMGIGIKNVHDRIRYTYGEPSGLEYRRLDGWTIAEIRIPVRRNENV
jgi:two-component system sensor histidine kinase YesM